MKKFAVVFDTNSYRQFVVGKTPEQVVSDVSKLRLAEDKKSILPFGILVVGMEMLANLAENNDIFNYNDCLNGVVAMGHHCYDKTQESPRIIPQPYLHITRSFFNTTPSEIEQRVKNLGGVIDDIRCDRIKAIEYHKTKGTFLKIKNYVDNEENMFSIEIINLIEGAKQEIINKHPRIAPKQLRTKLLEYLDEGPFEPIVALTIIFATSITLGLKLSYEEAKEKAKAMNSEFPLSVGFYRWVCSKIVSDNIDMQSKTSKQKRWNWQWDYQVSFLMSAQTIDNREIILVTSDKDMTEMLKDLGFQNKVFTMTEYLDFLESAN